MLNEIINERMFLLLGVFINGIDIVEIIPRENKVFYFTKRGLKYLSYFFINIQKIKTNKILNFL